MKLSAFFFCLGALLTLAEAQYPCTFKNAVLYIVQGGPDTSPATSDGSSFSSNGSSGGPDQSSVTSDVTSGTSNGSSNSSSEPSDTSDGSSASSNESSSNLNVSSAADDSSLDPPPGGLTTRWDNAATGTKLIADSIKARALHFGRPLSERAVFTCTPEETCYTVNNGLFCANGRNGDFHEPDGTVGSINTGDYTLVDGRKGNLYTGPPPPADNDASSTAAVLKSFGNSTRTASASELAAATVTTARLSALSSQATGTESRPSTTASPPSNTSPATFSASSSLQAGSSVSAAATSSTGVPGSAASGIQLPNRTVAAVMSILAACLLWRTWLF